MNFAEHEKLLETYGELAIDHERALAVIRALFVRYPTVAQEILVGKTYHIYDLEARFVTSITESQRNEVIKLINEYKKVDAIKLLRSFTVPPIGLKEAKDAVEYYKNWE